MELLSVKEIVEMINGANPETHEPNAAVAFALSKIKEGDEDSLKEFARKAFYGPIIELKRSNGHIFLDIVFQDKEELQGVMELAYRHQQEVDRIEEDTEWYPLFTTVLAPIHAKGKYGAQLTNPLCVNLCSRTVDALPDRIRFIYLDEHVEFYATPGFDDEETNNAH